MIIAITLSFTGLVNAQTYYYTLMPGKNYEIINKSRKEIRIYKESKEIDHFDEAAYYKENSYDSFWKVEYYRNKGYTHIQLYPEGRTVVTVWENSKPIVIKNDINYEIREIEYPALHYGILKSGKTYEFKNLTYSKIDIGTSPGADKFFDEAGYIKSDIKTYQRKSAYTPISILGGGSTLVTVPSSSPDIEYYYCYDEFDKRIEVREVEGPSLYVGVLEPGKSYEFTNKSGKNIEMKAKYSKQRYFDQTLYYNDGNLSVSRKKDKSSILLMPKGRTVVTVPSTSLDIEYYYGYNEFIQNIEIKEVKDPALYVSVLKSGKTYEFINKSELDIYLENDFGPDKLYDADIYYEDGKVVSNKEIAYTRIYIPPKGRTVVTVPQSSTDIEFFYAYDEYMRYVIDNTGMQPKK